MEIIQYDLPVGQQELWLAPLGDIQWNGEPREIALDHLNEHVARAVDLKAKFIGMGDYIDFLSPSGRRKVAQADHYDNALKAFDHTALRLNEELVTGVLKPTIGQWLGMLEGHHFATLKAGMTSDMELCKSLLARFLGTSCIIKINFHPRPDTTASFQLWAHHGKGSGKAARPIQILEGVSGRWDDIDLFLIGHMTKLATAPIQRTYSEFKHGVPDGRLRHRRVSLAGTGGWSKAYLEQSRDGQVPRGSYVEKAMMDPVSLGAPLIRLWVHRDRKDGQDTLEIRHEVTA